MYTHVHQGCIRIGCERDERAAGSGEAPTHPADRGPDQGAAGRTLAARDTGNSFNTLKQG